MALRLIRELGDPVLGKKAKTVKEMSPKLKALIEDMKEPGTVLVIYDACKIAWCCNTDSTSNQGPNRPCRHP